MWGSVDKLELVMNRRELLLATMASVTLCPKVSARTDKWGQSSGYPSGLHLGFQQATATRVGNYSGGYERYLPHNNIGIGSTLSALRSTPTDVHYRWGFSRKTPEEYMKSWPVTGLLIARGSDVLFESYGFERDATMRLTSWSMAKSVTSMLLGIAINKKLIDSYDDPASKYVEELKGTLHGEVTLRNLSNMSSGAEVSHNRDNSSIYPMAYLSPNSSIRNTVKGWNRRREDQGRTYNYNELCPLTIGMVLRNVSGGSLASFCEENLWKPLGAEAPATWSTDSERSEFNCIGFGATLRDWARLGMLVANGGVMDGRQIISQSWLRECTTWSARDSQVRFGVAGSSFGYKAHMWHAKPDGSRPYFNGHHGQRVVVDLPTNTVMAHTAVDHEGNWQQEMFALFDAVTKT
jgi:hypothetical protein